jgi:hypothetical protein
MTRKLTIATAIGLVMMASGAYAEQIKTYPGQPLCSDQDSLLAVVIAGIHGDLDAMNAVTGCHVIPAGSTAEVIERLPSGADFMRVVKVKVTSPNMKATTGLTIEIDRRTERGQTAMCNHPS